MATIPSSRKGWVYAENWGGTMTYSPWTFPDPGIMPSLSWWPILNRLWDWYLLRRRNFRWMKHEGFIHTFRSWVSRKIDPDKESW